MGYMLEIKDIYKTFNAGTINEKRALNGVNLNLNPEISLRSSVETEQENQQH